MLRRSGQVLLCFAMFSIAGGHWALLQGVAWATMIAKASQTAPLAQAVQETFSGKKPCHLCHAVEEGRKKEQDLPATVRSDAKIDKFVARAATPLPAPLSRSYSYPVSLDEFTQPVSPEPAVPVPIGA